VVKVSSIFKKLWMDYRMRNLLRLFNEMYVNPSYNEIMNVETQRHAIILLSGGVDSTTLLYEYRKDIKLAVSFDYGSKHNKTEIKMAKLNCKRLNIPHKVIKLDFIKELFKSSLLSLGGEIPEGHWTSDAMKSTVVPFRNGIMLSIAAGLAESEELNTILIANHFGDHSIYPDCRKVFIKSMNDAIKNGTYNNISILAPYTNITKRDIALIGRRLNIDYTKTYSCYKGKIYHCGLCGTCVERIGALDGFDKTIYKNDNK
jgi:7-cyano-7-deazaguanine synthase